MKELTIEQKAKAYDEAFRIAQELYNDPNSSNVGKGYVCTVFPEVKESDDENIRKWIIAQLELKSDVNNPHDLELMILKSIAWLEKQGEQKPYMIQWKGNNLKEIVEFTGKSPKFNDWFKTWEEYENYVHTHNNIFKIFNEDGSHVEVPVGAWIIKTPDGYNVASRYVFKQKSADKVEPKFKVGDFIINNNSGGVYQITEIRYDEYCLWPLDADIEGYLRIIDVDNEHHLWTIQDAKDGDVLTCNEEILLFKSYSVKCRISLYCWYNGQTNNFHSKGVVYTSLTTRNKICPATKEQRELLFTKMKDAGYEWDSEKKELKKQEIAEIPFGAKDSELQEITYYIPEGFHAEINGNKVIIKKGEQESAWSEEDERIYQSVIDDTVQENQLDDRQINWLKSLKDRVQPHNRWKPSDVQMERLSDAIKHYNSWGYDAPILKELLNDLKKLGE